VVRQKLDSPLAIASFPGNLTWLKAAERLMIVIEETHKAGHGLRSNHDDQSLSVVRT
jgi:hypothetical protein